MIALHRTILAGACLAAALVTGCAGQQLSSSESYSEAERQQHSADMLSYADGGSLWRFPAVYTAEFEIKKIGLLSVANGGPYFNGEDTKGATEFAAQLTKQLEARGFEVVPLAKVAKAPAWAAKGDAGGGGYAPGSRDFSGGIGGSTFTSVTQDDEWMSNLQRETGCDAFVVAGYWWQKGRNAFAFIPLDAEGWNANMYVFVPYNKLKAAATANSITVGPNAMNPSVLITFNEPVAGSDDNASPSIATAADFLVRAFRRYYPKPLS